MNMLKMDPERKMHRESCKDSANVGSVAALSLAYKEWRQSRREISDHTRSDLQYEGHRW